MAPENEKNNPDGTVVEEQAAVKKKKGLPPIVLYVVIAVVMVAVGVVVGTKFIGGAESVDGEPVAEEKAAPEKKEHQEGEPTELFTVADLVVNPAGTEGTRFLSASIGFETYSKHTLELMEKREHLVRDALITILGSKTIDQLSDPKQKEIIRFQIKKRTEQLLQVDDLAAVYFTQFILQ
jgi:flagellar FliL protein